MTVVIVFFIILVAGLSVFTVLRRRAPAASAEGGEGTRRTATTVRVTPVRLGTIENSVVINGDVLARNQVAIYPTVAGKLTELRLGIGDRVSRGDVAAMVDPSRPGEIYFSSPVVSTVSGTVLQSPLSIGDTVGVTTPVYVVGDLSSLMVETFVPERYAVSVRRGLPAQVSLEALPGETFSAVVDEVNPVLDPASRTLKIRLRFGSGGQDGRIKAGMFATISLVTNVHAGVPVIPRESVINTYGSWIVFTVDEENIAHRQEIRLDLENESFIEVAEGLAEGDIVVSAGQNFLTDGDLVRIVE
jgi:multidrug efflux pump subunit AcrA (membrane-fusion protein)